MCENASKVKTGQVTFASRNAEYGGFKIKKGDILALNDGKLAYKSKDPAKAAIKLIHSLVSKSTEFITIIYGNNVTEEQAQAVFDNVQCRYKSHADVSLINGKQDIYHFIISIE